MRNEKEIRELLDEKIYELPDAKQGTQGHVLREKIRLLRWVLKEE